MTEDEIHTHCIGRWGIDEYCELQVISSTRM